MSAPELTVAIPAYKEAANLRHILPRLAAALAQVEHETLVVDTSSPQDDTRQVCADNGAGYINREGGDSYGDAVRSAIRHARGKYLLFMDADGSHRPEFVPQMLAARGERVVVAASRYVEGGGSENGAVSVLMSRTLNRVYCLALGIDCRDISNSFKLYNADALKKLKLECANFDIIEEMLFKLARADKGLAVKELPYVFQSRIEGRSKRNLLLFIFSYLRTLVKLRLS